jgi:hypothetical protein
MGQFGGEQVTLARPPSASPRLAIQGFGVAGSCCAHLLTGANVEAALSPARPAPVVMLSDAALALLRDTFARPDLLAERPRIERRIVAWGGADPVALPHGGIVLSEAELLAALGAPRPRTDPAPPDESFTIHAAPPFPAGELRRFGRRPASAARVRLHLAEDDSACWIEAVEDGWLFMLPTGEGHGWLLAVGTPIETIAARSQHLASRIELVGSAAAHFESAPRILTMLHGADWLACGSAAIRFDPICGDGTAQAVREAILAAAVLTAIAEGGHRDELLLHYESLLLAAMRRHLRLCAQFYSTGGRGSWWREQQAALAAGFDWCTGRLSSMPEPRYRLEGFRLVRQELAA